MASKEHPFKKHAELLRPLLTADRPRFVTESGSTLEDRLLLREAKDAGFINCVMRCDQKGIPSDFANITITALGRSCVAEVDQANEVRDTLLRSVGQSGGITAGSVNIGTVVLPVPKAPERAKTIWQTIAGAIKLLGLLLGCGVSLVGILKYREKHTSVKQESPKIEEPQKQEPMPVPSNNASSTGQQGGITGGVVNINTAPAMQPQVEGVRVSQRQVPSPREDAPYAVELTVQVASSVQPFAIGVICNREIVDSKFTVVGQDDFTQVGFGPMSNDPKTYFLRFNSPAVTPSSPLVITLMCKDAFEILAVHRMNP